MQERVGYFSDDGMTMLARILGEVRSHPDCESYKWLGFRRRCEQRFGFGCKAQARRSHTQTRKARLKAFGIDADRIKSCFPPL